METSSNHYHEVLLADSIGNRSSKQILEKAERDNYQVVDSRKRMLETYQYQQSGMFTRRTPVPFLTMGGDKQPTKLVSTLL